MISTRKLRCILLCTRMMLRQMTADAMLAALLVAPLLYGLLFRFGLPALEGLLAGHFGRPILAPYYQMADLLIALLGGFMMCFAAAMVVLEENDDKTASYYAVTPLGKTGYLASRMGAPMLLSLVVTPISLLLFGLTPLSGLQILVLSVLGTLQGAVLAMLIVGLANNKLEGMALAKLCGVILLGMPAPYFLQGNVQYLLFFLPSFWMAKGLQSGVWFFYVLCALVSAVWLLLLRHRFVQRIRG